MKPRKETKMTFDLLKARDQNNPRLRDIPAENLPN